MRLSILRMNLQSGDVSKIIKAEEDRLALRLGQIRILKSEQ